MRRRMRALVLLVSSAFRSDARRAVGIAGVTIVEALVRIMFALWLMLLLDATLARDLRQAAMAAAAYGVSVVLLGYTNSARISWGTVLAEKTGFFIDRRLISLTTSIPTVGHHEHPQYQDEIELIRQQRGMLGGIIDAVVSNLRLFMMLAANLFLLMRIHPLLGILPLFALPSLLTGLRETKITERARGQTAETLRSARHLFELATSSHAGKELRIFGLAPTIRKLQDQRWSEVDVTMTRAGIRGAAISTAGWMVFAAGYLGALAFVVYLAINSPETTTPGEVLLAFSLAGQLNITMEGAYAMARALAANLKTISRLVWLEDYAASVPMLAAYPAPSRIDDGIRFDGVTFAYPETESAAVLEIGLFLPAGSTVALVGENGAGKTTLVKLITAMYRPASGRILVDGVDLSEIDPESWRRRVAAGFQDFMRFEFLAQETVGVGDLLNINRPEAVAGALERAGASDVVAELPRGLETQLGRSFSDGVDLSGGQWQKLSLGRAMMRESPLLLVLDEPTASLDAETEHALFERYAAAASDVGRSSGAITLLVSHRFSTVRSADLIVVLDQGRVLEVGGHRELIARGGLYAQLFGLQASGYR